jgi:transglutaminase-like putative cysteine protease
MPARLLPATHCIDSNHPRVVAFVELHRQGNSVTEQAVSLFYAVRDGFRYDPYKLDLSADGMKASAVLENGYGWCVPKATLLAAACRAAGIPARLGFADVRNHLSTERMRQVMQTDVFYWHGFTEIWIEGAWRKATPAFNLELCERFGLLPLEFNGVDDSIYHPFDRAGHRHMEYLNMRGSFDDVPLAQMVADFSRHYPAMRREFNAMQEGDFLTDVNRETQS